MKPCDQRQLGNIRDICVRVPITENCSHVSLGVFVEASGTAALSLRPPFMREVACFWREELQEGEPAHRPRQLVSKAQKRKLFHSGQMFAPNSAQGQSRFHFELKSSGGWDFLPCYSVFPKNALVGSSHLIVPSCWLLKVRALPKAIWHQSHECCFC